MALNYSVIDRWVDAGSRILDLGCGDGALLAHLQQHKNVSALGVEIDSDNITACIARSVNVVEQNIDDGLANFADNSFDTVLLTQTLQAVHRPDFVLREMLRVGKQCVITFPNFGHWQARLHLVSKGRMPVSKFMPYSWYDTPNIHFCTVKDFEALCVDEGIRVIDRVFQSAAESNVRCFDYLSERAPNLFAAHAYYYVSR